MKTYATKLSDIAREWHLLDADSQILGRFACRIAKLLQGKHKVNFVPYLDCGDWVVVVNAGKIRITGRKREQKKYRWHTGYPGGFRELSFKQLASKDPTKIIHSAVRGMLPNNKLRDKRLARLKIFVGEEHGYKDKFKTKNQKLNTKNTYPKT